MKTLLAATAALVALALAPAAGAAPKLRFFQSPSRNIGCALSAGFARCDILHKRWTAPPRPASCPLDWGDGLSVSRTGRGRIVCAGDTVAGQGAVLRYGRSLRAGRITCTSRTGGIRCRNGRGHGFSLSRDAYRLF